MEDAAPNDSLELTNPRTLAANRPLRFAAELKRWLALASTGPP